MIHEAYEKLKKEHPILPEYHKLDKEFEISTIENEEFLIREIKKKVGERYEPILELLEHIISPDPGSLSDVYECRTFTNGEKTQIVTLFKHLMSNYRMLLETDLLGDDNKDAETIKKVSEAWMTDKKQLAPFFKKLREGWEKQIEAKEILEYLG